MNVEKNKHTLKDALEQMKVYDAPGRLWSNLESALDNPAPTTEHVLNEAVDQLPQHSPPPSVWNKLTKALDGKKTAKISLFYKRRKLISIAAAAAILLGVAFWTLRESPPTINKVYAQVTMQQFQLDIDWDADEDSFERIGEQLTQVNDPQLNNLKVELQELNAARNDVKKMLLSYGQDPQLVTQLGDIERERSDIYRQIIELI